MNHMTARTLQGSRRLIGSSASWLWDGLRRAFPDAVAACLMPDHLHLIAPAVDDDRLARVLQHHTRNFGGPGWRAAPDREPIAGGGKLARQIRYVLLNPCRAALTRDPASWLWSTHRDLIGAVDDPWVPDDRVAGALGRRAVGFRSWMHRYVTGDPDVLPAASEVPEPADAFHAGPAAIGYAARMVRRDVATRPAKATLKLFLAAARRLRHPMREAAAHVDVPLRRAYRWSRDVPERSIQATLLCLAHPRLSRPADVRRPTSRSRHPSAVDGIHGPQVSHS